MHFPDFAISKITPKDGLQGLCKEVKSYSTKTFKELNSHFVKLFFVSLFFTPATNTERPFIK